MIILYKFYKKKRNKKSISSLLQLIFLDIGSRILTK